MGIVSFAEDREVIQTILKHLRLGLLKSKPVPYLIREPTPKAHTPPVGYVRDHFSQLSMNDAHLYGDPDYAWGTSLHS